VKSKYNHKSMQVSRSSEGRENPGHWRQVHMVTDRVWFRVRHSEDLRCVALWVENSPEGQSRSRPPIVECTWTIDQSSPHVRSSELRKEVWFKARKPLNTEVTK
jgi:hypothetical protein